MNDYAYVITRMKAVNDALMESKMGVNNWDLCLKIVQAKSQEEGMRSLVDNVGYLSNGDELEECLEKINEAIRRAT